MCVFAFFQASYKTSTILSVGCYFTSYMCDPKGVKGKIRLQKPNKMLCVVLQVR